SSGILLLILSSDLQLPYPKRRVQNDMLYALIGAGDPFIQEPYGLPPHHFRVPLYIIKFTVYNIESLDAIQADTGHILRQAFMPFVKRLQEAQAGAVVACDDGC